MANHLLYFPLRQQRIRNCFGYFKNAVASSLHRVICHFRLDYAHGKDRREAWKGSIGQRLD